MTTNQLCALTGRTGKFVKSHIIPLALTRLERTGEKFVEAGIGLGIKTKSNSWYDNALVTREGEDILADIDAKGIEALRKHKLVWSGWSNEKELFSDDQVLHNGVPHHRFIQLDCARDLQLLFLSILWRAAASKRSEFQDFTLEPAELEQLRVRVLNKDPGDFGEYPIQLFQISTLGIHHNRTPLMESKEIPNADASPTEIVEYARIYFDGLTAHLHLPRGKALGEIYIQTCLGNPEGTVVFLHRFENSRAQANIVEMIETVHQEQITPQAPLKPIASAIQSSYAIPTENCQRAK
ncbi:hypothetical protein [Delftia sp. RIT313]|uniref:hypothetical protein n=1 Tax=Delftia sp. RIT313 TaxID=1468410 RepID=UPI00044D0278|nr:hypothetical protein [Delftia sp. RIT313]EZP45591.1 hypothetical protein BW39_05950 [Delftia sp. RIT313]